MAELVRSAETLHSRGVRLLRLVLVVLLLCASCKKKDDAAIDIAPELPVVSETTTNLLLTWIDDKGDFHIEEKASAVPPESRDSVKVQDPSRDPLTGGRIFMADLRNAAPNGTYPVKVVPMNEFDDIAVTRRAKHGIVLAPREAGAEPGAAASADTDRPAVIIYGASWCGPCHQAEAYLKQKGVPYVKYDIEQESTRAREMQAKLTKAGVRGGSIPVLDVRGKILVGFDQRADVSLTSRASSPTFRATSTRICCRGGCASRRSGRRRASRGSCSP